MFSLIPSSTELDIDELLRFSWATSAIFALLVLEIGTEIGEYLRLLEQNMEETSFKNGNIEKKILKKEKSIVIKSSSKAIVISTTFLVLSGIIITLNTQRMDWRMTIILNGLSRLEAATILFFISVKTPSSTGIYHSPSGTKRLYLWSKDINFNDVDSIDNVLSNLEYNVMKSIFEIFSRAYFLLLPFVGHPISFVSGVCIGLCIDVCIFYARRSRSSSSSRKWITYSLSSILAILSAILFTSGCIYIKMVWNIHWFKSKWGLAATAFTLWLMAILLTHYKFWKVTEHMKLNYKSICKAAANERLATSILLSFIKTNYDKKGNTNEDGDKNEEAKASVLASIITEEERMSRFYIFFSFLLAITTIASIFIGIVNIGATRQMNVVRQKFPIVHAKFYDNMNDGPVCAMKLKSKDIKTFKDQYSVKRGYKIIHCGACSACSNYHNLRLQYTTRKSLAADAQICAKKSLYLGRDAVHQCLEQSPTIGFQGECATCWTDDIYCARNNCAFIFLQSTLINKVSNFEVGPNDITAATCEEANCELDFVPCSGANRRRMNIQSDIERPKDQQCTIVQFDWEQLFGESDGDEKQKKRDSSTNDNSDVEGNEL